MSNELIERLTTEVGGERIDTAGGGDGNCEAAARAIRAKFKGPT